MKFQAIHIDYGFEKKIATAIAKILQIPIDIYRFADNSPWLKIDNFILCASNSIHQFWIYPFVKNKIEQSGNNLIIDGYLMNEVIGGLSTLNVNNYSDINSIYPPLSKNFAYILHDNLKNDFLKIHDSQVHGMLPNIHDITDYDRYLAFTILNYGRRFTLLFSIVHQNLCSVGLPILDYDLFDFCLKIPFQFKVNSKFYRDMVVSAHPEVARVPWSRNRLPLNSKREKHWLFQYLNQLNELKYYVSRMTQGKIETLPGYDKNRLFRKNKNFRAFYMEVIFNDLTFDKHYVLKKGLEKIVDLIDSGRNYFIILEKVAVIELVTRELMPA